MKSDQVNRELQIGNEEIGNEKAKKKKSFLYPVDLRIKTDH